MLSMGGVRRAFWLALTLAACGGSSKPPPAQPAPVVENRPAPRPEEPIDEAPATQPTPGQPPYNPTWQSGIQSCDAYTRMMAMCIENPKFPDAARQATRDALAQMQQAWGGMVNSGPDALRAISDACVQAIQAMSQAGDAMCPGVFPPAPPATPARP